MFILPVKIDICITNLIIPFFINMHKGLMLIIYDGVNFLDVGPKLNSEAAWKRCDTKLKVNIATDFQFVF